MKIEDELFEVIEEFLNKDKSEIGLQHDLGISENNVDELQQALENKFDIRIWTDSLLSIKTVKSLITYIRIKIRIFEEELLHGRLCR